ncbi:hypothetical protein [Thaumasiovibrio subtropicus]|uniref:hypothetical protein n=1 Tax=Thaumasiovibrio subtropicus TaxID=1891207 RepID=UPI000B356CE2|nr:hypothetical protein [Thaumasiovibrio subtropicus]
MAWEMGVAQGYRDLLVKVHDLAVANGWTVERWIQEPEGDDELILSTNGGSEQEFFTVGLKTDYSVTHERYNLKVMSSLQYSFGDSFETQPQQTELFYFYLWQHDMPYLISLDKDHIKIACQVSVTTHCTYLGNIRSYASLGHWPRRNGCWGEGTSANANWASQGDSYSNFLKLSNYAGQIMWIDNHYFRPALVHPSMYTYGLLHSDNGNNAKRHWMIPLSLVDGSLTSDGGRGMLGEFIGCFFISGANTSTWSIITSFDGERQFLAIQNIYRTSNVDFMAWELK